MQFHVRDLAEHLIGLGHDGLGARPGRRRHAAAGRTCVSAGRAVPVRYNGSVARLNFGPLGRPGAPLAHDGEFDVLHIHEPATP